MKNNIISLFKNYFFLPSNLRTVNKGYLSKTDLLEVKPSKMMPEQNMQLWYLLKSIESSEISIKNQFDVYKDLNKQLVKEYGNV